MMRNLIPLALLFLIPASVGADTPAGRIVYSRRDGERSVLHVINADGTGDQELPGQTARSNFCPAASPDGKRVAFMSFEPGTPPQVTVVTLKDGAAAALTPPARLASLPAWSPGGKMLAFVSGAETPAVWVSEPDGTAARQVSPGSTRALFPFWSRDGKSVGYTRLADGKGEIALLRLDGEETVLTRNGKMTHGGPGAVSPDGKRLAYLVADAAAKSGSIRVSDLATRVENTVLDLDLAHAGAFRFAPTPAWTPDGKALLVPIAGEKGRGLYRVSEDGKTRTRITPEGVDCFQAVSLP